MMLSMDEDYDWIGVQLTERRRTGMNKSYSVVMKVNLILAGAATTTIH